MECVACDMCGADDTRPVYRVHDTNYGTSGEHTIVKCRRCGMVYLNPRPNAAELPAFYPAAQYDPFRAAYGSNPTPSAADRQRSRWLTRILGRGKVLDVGYGSGLFLNAMQSAGWECVGIDTNEAVAALVRRQFGLDVRAGDIFAVDGYGAFDLLTLWDVLEHTPSPRAVLTRAHRLLNANGAVALSLPNWDSLERQIFRQYWIALDAPRHLFHFSPATIHRALRECGFEVQTLQARAPVLSIASNVLRAGGQLLARHRESPARAASGPSAAAPRVLSARRRLAIGVVHSLMTPPNAIINALGRGASLVVVARKAKAT